MNSRHIDHRWSIVVPLRYPPLLVRPLLDIDPTEPDAVPARGVKGDVDAVKAAIFVLKQVWRGFLIQGKRCSIYSTSTLIQGTEFSPELSDPAVLFLPGTSSLKCILVSFSCL